jgi:Uncharacterized protein conserved in bacteria (DUF2147)
MGETHLARQVTRLVIAGLVVLLATIQSVAAHGPSAAGLWQKIDEKSGKAVVWFLFIDRGGVYEGIAAKLFQRDGFSHSICSRCRDDRKDAALLGLPIIRHMRRNGLRYEGGDILDPRDGSIYSAVMTISPDGQTLGVRGYLGFEFLGRNDIWYRLPDSAFKQLDTIVVAKYLPGQSSTVGSVTPVRHPQDSTTTNPAHPTRKAGRSETRRGQALASSDPSQMLPSETSPVQIAMASTSDPLHSEAKEAVSAVKTLGECSVAEVCIDQYLWSLYQRTPKLDTIKVVEQRRVGVKKNRKLRTIIENITKLVDEDFTWKDPRAAEKAGMPLMEYVIGGMDRTFKLKLYHALRAMDETGLAPGITSAFRDDYRQSLASGLKAAIDRSYHGGSFRGGYGHGLAVDVVSVKGNTRAERSVSSEKLWKWIDTNGKEFGIGRPYLDKDPAHLAPIDGKEYIDHHRQVPRQSVAMVKKTRTSAMNLLGPDDVIGSAALRKGGTVVARQYELRNGKTLGSRHQ